MKKALLFGSVMLATINLSFGQSHVTTGGVKHPFVEEFTGVWCGYCVDGAQILQQDIEDDATLGPKTVITAIHSDGNYGWIYDSLMITDGQIMANAYVTGFPTGMVDRVAYGSPASVAMGVGNFPGACAAELTKPNTFDVSLDQSYDAATKTVTLTVTAKAITALTGKYNVNCYVMLDSIPSSGIYAQHSYRNAAGSMCQNGKPSWYVGKGATLGSADYAHMNVVMAMLGGNIGTAGVITDNPAAGATFTKTYTYVLTSGAHANLMNTAHLKFAAFVNKAGTTTSDRPVQNAVLAKFVPNAAAVANVNKMDDVQIYPNPARNFINIKGMLNTPADTKITILNAIGQTVISKEYKAAGNMFGETIAIDNLNNGIYFVCITNNGETITKKLTVNK